MQTNQRHILLVLYSSAARASIDEFSTLHTVLGRSHENLPEVTDPAVGHTGAGIACTTTASSQRAPANPAIHLKQQVRQIYKTIRVNTAALAAIED